MKYVDIKGEQEILSIEINQPKLCPGYEYYYPDGIIKGFWKKSTYFLRYRDWIIRRNYYYSTPQEAIEDSTLKTLFPKDGKIWVYGDIKTTLRSKPDFGNIIEFQDPSTILEYLENLEFKWGVNLGSLVCLESSTTESLYEYKNKLSIEVKR